MDISIPLLSEKFELLSAYLDGEVSATERKQVEEWLTSDADLQKTYQQMLALQGGLRSIPAAQSMPTEQLVSQVMKRLDRQQAKLWAWGSVGAAAALVIGALSSLLTGNQSGMMQIAQQPKSSSQSIEVPQPSIPTIAMQTESVNPKALMIMLERPAVEIPVVPTSKSNRLNDDSVSNF